MSAATIYQALSELPGELEEEYDSLTETSVEQQLVLMSAIDQARADLAMLRKKIETEVLGMVPDKARRLSVEGLGEVEFRRSDKYTEWDNDALTRVIVARALDERVVDEDGVSEPGWEAVTRALTTYMRPSWRYGALRDGGIDPTEFCTYEKGARTVKLPSRSIA